MQDPYITRLRGTAAARHSALVELYRELGPAIRGYAIRHHLQDSAATDVVQKVFEVLLTKLPAFRGEKPVSHWLWGIARNLVLEQHRAQKSAAAMLRWPDNVGDDDTDRGTADVLQQLSHWPLMEEPLCMQQALAAFADAHPERAQVLQFVVEGWTIAEMAQHLDRSEGATRQYLSECRRKLAPYIKPCLDRDDQKHLDNRRKLAP